MDEATGRNCIVMAENHAVWIPVSIGELIDKITILKIKNEMLEGQKQKDAEDELRLLEDVLSKISLKAEIGQLYEALFYVNRELWLIEDSKRLHEARKDFGKDFVFLARQVYLKNDKRASIKLEINRLSNSSIREVKSHNLDGDY